MALAMGLEPAGELRTRRTINRDRQGKGPELVACGRQVKAVPGEEQRRDADPRPFVAVDKGMIPDDGVNHRRDFFEESGKDCLLTIPGVGT